MATYPLAHSSSPAVVKVTNTSPTIATAAFDPPARIAIVVGVTSDADTNAGAAPTLTAITGLTWTRVGPVLGFSATGDVGLVALFQGVLDNPATDLGSITVTANVGISVSKPKMLVVRVYDETQVDISDPIGAFTSGSFATSTSFLGTVTPETSDGGLRGLWLDWAATGVPTLIQPNNDNAEIVDTYHNAGLSTNGQISRRNRTVAGVAQSLGVNLLATSSDGNWLVYELRSPQPAAGSAIDSTAFDSSGFDTGSSSPAPGSGSGSGSVVLTGAATGKRIAKASAAASLAFVGSSTGKRTPKSSATGSLSFSGASVGGAPTPPPGSGSGSGSVGFAGSATGKRTAKASGSGTVTFTGSASGRSVRRGIGTGTLATTGSAVGKRTPHSTGNATLAFVGTGTGKRSPKSSGGGAVTFAGSAVGNSPTPGLKEGYGTGSVAWAGSAIGRRTPKGGGSSAVAFVGAASGARSPRATGVGSLSLAGAAVGQRPGAPTQFNGRILSARLLIPAASGSIAVPTSSGDLIAQRATGHLSTLRARGVIT